MSYRTIHSLILLIILLISWTGVVYAEELLRIEIKKDGVYYIYPGDLQNADIPLDIDPRTIKIFNQGVDIPIYIHGEGDGRLDSSDYIEFYAVGISRDSEYYEFTDTNIYWLEGGGEKGKRVTSRNGAPGVLAPPLSFINHLHVEKDLVDWLWGKPDNEEDDYWFWEKISAGKAGEYSFTLKNIDRVPGDCAVKVSVHGRTDVFISTDHHTRIYLNNTLLKEEEWDGMVPKKWEISDIPCNLFNEGENRLKIEAVGVSVTDPSLKDILDLDNDGILDIDSIYLNWFDIDYRNTYTAKDDYLKFTGSGDGSVDFAISNFNDNRRSIAVLDITRYPSEVYRFNDIMMGDEFPYGISFKDVLKIGQQKEYVATATHMGTPYKMTKYILSSSLKDRTNMADYIIITHGDLHESALTLANYRKTQGLKVAVIKVNDIYDEFSSGIFTPAAIKNFLAYAYNYWSLRPRYIVLLGDANYDYKDIYNFGEPNMVPTYMIPGEFGLFPSDNWFVNVEGDVLPEMMVGRISVKSATEAASVVDKIIRYEIDPQAQWHKNLLFVADDNDYEFEGLSDILSSTLPADYSAKKVYMGTYYDLIPDDTGEAKERAKADVIAGLDNGALMTIYTGHGDIDQWADEHMIDSYDVLGYVLGTKTKEGILKNFEKPSFVITLNCLNGFFPVPNEDWVKNEGNPGDIPLAEAFLKLNRRGAVAVWSPTSLGYTWAHSALAGHLFDALFKDGTDIIGEAILKGKTLAYRNDDISEDIVNMYTLFGDPATRLKGIVKNQKSGNPSGSSGSDSGGGGCFIATAAYGSALHPHLKYLRDFRDTYLLTNGPGRELVRLYYRYSPPIAEYITERPFLRMVIRIWLLPLVVLAWVLTTLTFIQGALAISSCVTITVISIAIYLCFPKQHHPNKIC